MNAARAEAAFWAAFLRNRNVDAQSSSDGAVPVAGGFALCLAGTFFDHGLGIGSARPLRPDDLAVLAEFYGRRGLAARFELDETVLERDQALLAAGGYAADGSRTVVFEAPTAAAVPAAFGEEVAVRETHDRRGWTELAVRGFEDSPSGDERERLRRSMQVAAAAAHGLFVASLGGVDAGAAAVGISGDFAYLFSGSVLPEHRRRGAHRALVAARMAFAQVRGAPFAVLKATPDSVAEQSLLELGFARTALRRRVQRSAP